MKLKTNYLGIKTLKILFWRIFNPIPQGKETLFLLDCTNKTPGNRVKFKVTKQKKVGVLTYKL